MDEALDEDFTQLFFEPTEIKETHIPSMMARIVSFEEFIASYPFNKTASPTELTMQVDDAFCLWNQGVWHLQVENGKGSVTLLTEAIAPDYVGTIQDWVPVFLGAHSLEKAVFLEKITLNSKNNKLNVLLPKEQPNLYDYF